MKLDLDLSHCLLLKANTLPICWFCVASAVRTVLLLGLPPLLRTCRRRGIIDASRGQPLLLGVGRLILGRRDRRERERDHDSESDRREENAAVENSGAVIEANGAGDKRGVEAVSCEQTDAERG